MSDIPKSKLNVLLDEQQAQIKCFNTLCQDKSNKWSLTINGLSSDEIIYLIVSNSSPLVS